jgi:ribosomal protein S11
MAQQSIGAIVERLERWNHATTTDPDKRGGEELCWQLAGKLGTRNPRKGMAFAHAAADISERGRASIPLDVRSMMVKIN